MVKVKSMILLIGVIAFIAIIGYATFLCLKLVWYSPLYFARARLWVVSWMERRGEGGGVEMGGLRGDGDVDGETLYEGGEEGKGGV